MMKSNSLTLWALFKRRIKKHFYTQDTSSGQMLVLFALMSSMMFLFTALGIDFGLIYLSKARLSQAVDSLGVRLAGNLPLDATNRANVALQIMRANYEGFLDNVIYETNTGFSPSNAVVFTALGANSDRITITNETQKLQIDTSAATVTNVTPPLKIVTVSAQATTKQPTYFLRLANITNINLGETAEAERVPSVIVLVLDVSGSMRGNHGWEYLPVAVTNFVNNFTNSQDQDFLAVVTFSSYATMMWPTNYLGAYSNYQSQMLPANNFVDPVTAFMTNTPSSGGTNALISQGIRFGGVTCAQEGMRLGYQVMNNLLGGITDTQLRAKLRTYYVIFTDGEFNTTRTYVRGTGFGQKVVGGTLTNFYHSTNTNAPLPFFHYQAPLMCNSNDFSSYTNVVVYGNTNMTSSNVYNLNVPARFGNYSGATNTTWTNFLDAINCTLAGYQIHGDSWYHRKITNDFNSPAASVPIYWTNQTVTNTNHLPSFGSYTSAAGSSMRQSAYWTNTSTTSYIITNCMNHYIWTNGRTDDNGRGWTSWNNRIFTNTNAMHSNTAAVNAPACYGTNNGLTNMWWMALYEVFKATPDPAMIVPTPILFDEQNPTKQTWYPTNAADYNMNTRYLSTYPCGRTFANIYGMWFDRTTGSRAPTNLPDVNTSGTIYGSARLSDFYPEFTYGAHPTNVFGFTNTNSIYSGLRYPKNLMTMITNNTNGIRYEMYSFRDTNWKTFSYNTSTYKLPSAGWVSTNSTYILNEGNWLTMMQAWIARKEQNAQIYFVNFSNTANYTEKRQIANDRTGNCGVGITPFFKDQPAGGFYNTADQNTLTAAFDDIARKINARLTK
ncbi:MAG: VWA domain-containing protein [Verrucomicrobiota bacterium]